MTLTRILALEQPHPFRRKCWRPDLTLSQHYTGMYLVASDKPNQPYLLTLGEVTAEDWGFVIGTAIVIEHEECPPSP